MSMRFRVPLYTRASDRGIGDCPAQWHIANQGIEEHTASWFELGTALHTTIEECMGEGLTLRRARNRAWKNVRERIAEYEDYKPMLWSPNRPKEELEEISKRLITNWYHDWMSDDTHRIIPWVYWPPRMEVFIVVPPDLTPEGIAGIRTQADALFTCRRCKGDVIVDWKTGRTRRSDPVQLQTYRYGLELLGFRMCSCEDRGWGFFYHLEHRKLQQVEEYDVAEVEWMMASSQATKKELPIKAIPSWKCDWCVGRSVCPIWEQDPADQSVRQVTIELNRERYEWIEDPTIMEGSSQLEGDSNG